MIGVFGGTFDPPHIGHLILADEARAALSLERVLWVVAGEPPHRPTDPLSDAETRARMVEAAIRGNPGFELSRVDLDRPGPHFSLDTMRLLAEDHPDAEFAYLMGSDSLLELPIWHRPQRFLSLCALLGVLRRHEDQIDLEPLDKALPGIREKITFLDVPLIGISGSSIRRRVAEDAPYRYMVPESVQTLIEDLKLYL